MPNATRTEEEELEERVIQCLRDSILKDGEPGLYKKEIRAKTGLTRDQLLITLNDLEKRGIIGTKSIIYLVELIEVYRKEKGREGDNP